MTRIKQHDTISNLQYALTELHCNKCGSPLKWKTNFSDIKHPTYLSSHCNQDFIISVASVRIAIKMAQALKKDQHRGKQKHARGISSNLISRNPKQNIADYDNNEKKTNPWTRELVLPTDSNLVKGNV